MKKPENEAQVVAHISFSGLAVVDMAMQRKVDDKYYLYVQHSKDEGVSIIDVSKPSQAKTLGVISWPDPAASSRMNVTGNLAIIAESQMLPMRSSTSNDDLDFGICPILRPHESYKSLREWSSGSKTSGISFMC